MSTFNFNGNVNAGTIGNTMPQPLDIKVKLSPGATMPTKGSTGAAAYDLYTNENGTISEGRRGFIGTGVHLSLPNGYFCKIEGRSGLAKDYGIIVLGGVCDSDYRGEYKVMLFNSGDKPYSYKRGDRVAQILIYKHETASFKLVDNLDETERNASGFGSSGN
jgi:deoxyuridine 5'-triphosphate nucleotidohydrolase